MGNDQACKVLGIGTVMFKLIDGTERTLLKVRHMHTLKRSLISLVKLVNEGYIFKGHGIELKVVRCLMVCYKGELRNGIYCPHWLLVRLVMVK